GSLGYERVFPVSTPRGGQNDTWRQCVMPNSLVEILGWALRWARIRLAHRILTKLRMIANNRSAYHAFVQLVPPVYRYRANAYCVTMSLLASVRTQISRRPLLPR